MLEENKRFIALDVFRGMTTFLMIVVNTPGDITSTFSLLLHADWHGFTPTDLVFPSFMFAVGNALAFAKDKWQGKSFGQVFGKIFKRSLIIFILGYIMYWFPFMKWAADGSLTGFPISETRILGVLQRIALAYLVTAVMIYLMAPRQLIVSSGLMLLGYWLVLYVFGDYTLEGNAVLKFDLAVMGASHLWTGDGIPFDPEGILSTIPSMVNVIAGFLLGIYLRNGGVNFEKLAKMLMLGAVLLFVAFLWNFLLPINKKIWTSSYVVHTIGLDLIIIAIIIYLSDIRANKTNFTFFEIMGRNPLFIYLVSEYIYITFMFVRMGEGKTLYQSIYEVGFQWIGPYWGSLAFALTITMICWLVGKFMDVKKIYVRV